MYLKSTFQSDIWTSEAVDLLLFTIYYKDYLIFLKDKIGGEGSFSIFLSLSSFSMFLGKVFDQ